MPVFSLLARAMSELFDQRALVTVATLPLKGRVGYMKLLVEQLFEATDNFTLVQAVVRFDIDMSRQSGDMRTDRPDMQVMDVLDTGNRAHALDHLVDVDMSGNPLKEDVSGFAQNADGPQADDDHDGHGHQGIQDEPACVKHDHATDNHTHRCNCVANDMQKSAAHVQVVFCVTMQAAGGNQIHYQADTGNNEHLLALDRFGLLQAAQGFPQNAEGDQQQGTTVNQRGKNLGPVPAIGAGIGGRKGCQPDHGQGEDQGKQVHEDMGGIGQQRQRVGPESTRQLCDQCDCGQTDGNDKPFGDLLVEQTVIVTGTIVLARRDRIFGIGIFQWETVVVTVSNTKSKSAQTSW